MTAESEVLGHDVPGREMTNEEKVLALVTERPDGCSSFAIAIETHIQRGAVEFILEKLEHQGKVQFTRSGKGVLTWYPSANRGEVKPAPEPPAPIVLPKPAPIVKEDEERSAEDEERAACPVEGCGTMIIADREHMGHHLNHKHGDLQPRDRIVMLDRMYPRPPSPTLEDLKAEMEEGEDKKEPETDRLAGYMEKVDKGEISKPPAGSNMDKDTYAGPVRWPDKGTKLPKKPKRKAKEAKTKRIGRPPKDPNVKRVPCPIEGCKSQLIATRDNIGHHLKGQHHLPRVEASAYMDKLLGEEGKETVESLLDSVVNDRPCPGTDMGKLEESIQKTAPAESPATQPAVMGNVPEEDTNICSKEPEATHRCKICGCLWAFHPAGTIPGQPSDSWQMIGEGEICCRDAAMSDQIEPLEITSPEPEALPAQTEGPNCRGERPAPPEPEVLDRLSDICKQEPTPHISDHLPMPRPEGPKATYNVMSKTDPEEVSKAIKEALRKRVDGTMSAAQPDCDGCSTIALPRSPTADVITEVAERTARPKPVDPFAELVRRHRVSAGREISKLRKVERKMRRRAAAAEAMAERVRYARQIKERELRRFEAELAEVRG